MGFLHCIFQCSLVDHVAWMSAALHTTWCHVAVVRAAVSLDVLAGSLGWFMQRLYKTSVFTLQILPNERVEELTCNGS